VVSRRERAIAYDVKIRHQRRDPLDHAFDYPATAWVFDATNPPRLPRGLGWLAAFRPQDHVGDGFTLRSRLEGVLAEHGLVVGRGRITTMANPRVLGYVFNPLSLHWCYDESDRLVAVIAEVHNTYGGRHAYVLEPDERGVGRTVKAFYVSPFYPVDGRYQLVVPPPGERLDVTVTLDRSGERPFVATVRGRRRGPVSLWSALRHPLATRLVMARIKRQGIALWLKGLRPFPRPTASGRSDIDAGRWPDVARRPGQPIRAWFARILTRRALRRLPLQVDLPGGTTIGRGGPNSPRMALIRPGAFYDRVGATGLIGFGEAYMAGDWIVPIDSRQPAALPANAYDESPSLLPVDDLADVLTVFAGQISTLVPPWLQRLRQAVLLRAPNAQDNTLVGARTNISHHYDLSNELFELFLDPTMTYSSALFSGDPDGGIEPLEVAQSRKIDRLLDAAGVRAGSRLLEIGTGWGELALRAGARGAHVTTITLSKEQAELAEKRLSAAELADRVEVRLQDYREVTGTFDAVISVEMIEAVGANHWPEYFAVLRDRLAPGGRIALQAITMPHDRMIASMRTYTWILKYIFPGGQIASVRAIREQAGQAGLRIEENFGFGAHYAQTLRRWRSTFEARAAELPHLGFDEVFARMWSLYLAYSEAGFRSGYLDVNQFVLAHDPTSDVIRLNGGAR
jgi:cyclopropane fatty-acyl-phospholipid synthase-like methyltransferase/DUF1365 family protein